MDTLLSAVVTLVSQHCEVYNKRRQLSRRLQNMKYAEFLPGELNDRQLHPWYAAAVADGIDFYRRSNTYTYSHTNKVWYKSEKVKNAAREELVRVAALYSEYATDSKQLERLTAEIEAMPVHPFAKQINRYANLLVKLDRLSRKQGVLRTTLRQLSKLNTEIKVNFGSRSNSCPSDRISSITMGERTFKPKDFLNHVEFEQKVLE